MWMSCFVIHAEDGDVSKLAEVPAAQRKVVKRPQPKLDSHRYVREWWPTPVFTTSAANIDQSID